MLKKLHIGVVVLLLLISCNKSGGVDDEGESISAQLNIVLGASYEDDTNAINDDDKFSSLALFVFDSSNRLEHLELLESLSLTSTTEVVIETYLGNKTFYAIANYKDQVFEDASGSQIELNGYVTIDQLEELTVVNSDPLVANNLIMVATKEAKISSDQQLVEINLDRLAARVDVHIFKGDGFDKLCDDITVTKVVLHNTVLNSNLLVENGMPKDVVYLDQIVYPDKIIDYYEDDCDIDPSSATTSLYSYSNITDTKLSTTTYIEIELDDDGVTYSYVGYIYIEDEEGSSYSLQSNNVYQVTAILMPDSEIGIDVKINQWSCDDIDIYIDASH